MSGTYSTKSISKTLINELEQALKSVGPFGSVEVYIQNHTVTQITLRNIKKTSTNGAARLSQKRQNQTQRA